MRLLRRRGSTGWTERANAAEEGGDGSEVRSRSEGVRVQCVRGCRGRSAGGRVIYPPGCSGWRWLACLPSHNKCRWRCRVPRLATATRIPHARDRRATRLARLAAILSHGQPSLLPSPGRPTAHTAGLSQPRSSGGTKDHPSIGRHMVGAPSASTLTRPFAMSMRLRRLVASVTSPPESSSHRSVEAVLGSGLASVPPCCPGSISVETNRRWTGSGATVR